LALPAAAELYLGITNRGRSVLAGLMASGAVALGTAALLPFFIDLGHALSAWPAAVHHQWSALGAGRPDLAARCTG
jgi:hypothetical protein